MSNQETIKGIREQLKAIKQAITAIEFKLLQLELESQAPAAQTCAATAGLLISTASLVPRYRNRLPNDVHQGLLGLSRQCAPHHKVRPICLLPDSKPFLETHF
jgi:hypothetical protein